MAGSIFTASTYKEYIELLKKLLSAGEGVYTTPYMDDAKDPDTGLPSSQATIGIGFNIEGNEKLRDLVFDALDVRDRAIRDKLIIALKDSTLTKDDTKKLNENLNKILTDAGITRTFELTPTEVDNIFIKSIEDFEATVDKFLYLPKRVKDALGNMPEISNPSKERAVLLSMAWRSIISASAGGSPTLRKDILTGDRADAWYQIRYDSNKNKSSGVAKRNYIEAELFGLYGSGAIDQTQSIKTLQMYTRRRDKILAYEKAASTGATAIGLANSDISGFSLPIGVVDTIDKELKPAIDWLKQHGYGELKNDLLSKIQNLDGEYLIGDGDASNTSDHLGMGSQSNNKADLLMGLSGNNVLHGNGGDDILIGGIGNDQLEGGLGKDTLVADSGIDGLKGGEGDDTYLINTSLSYVEDSDSKGTLFIYNKEVGNVIETGRDSKIYSNNFFTVQKELDNTTLKVTSRINGSVVYIKNWQEDSLGIHLRPKTDPSYYADDTYFDNAHNRPVITPLRLLDPLTLDLDGDGIETLALSNSAPLYFDLDGDGIKNPTGWIKADDGLLVIDLNNNGLIDNGKELFGDATLLPSGARAKDGFEALAAQDSNKDGVVNASDTNWNKLRVWRDLNQDGTSQTAELFTLNALEINHFTLPTTTLSNATQYTDNGNFYYLLGSFARNSGTESFYAPIGATADVYFKQDRLQAA